MYSLKVRFFILLSTIAFIGIDSLIAAACLKEDRVRHVRIDNG